MLLFVRDFNLINLDVQPSLHSYASSCFLCHRASLQQSSVLNKYKIYSCDIWSFENMCVDRGVLSQQKLALKFHTIWFLCTYFQYFRFCHMHWGILLGRGILHGDLKLKWQFLNCSRFMIFFQWIHSFCSVPWIFLSANIGNNLCKK